MKNFEFKKIITMFYLKDIKLFYKKKMDRNKYKLLLESDELDEI
jgi:hypothetical protein